LQPLKRGFIRHNVPMSAFWLTSKTPIAPPTAANPTLRFLLYAGLVTGIWSGLASLVIYGIGSLARVPFAASRGLDAVPTFVPWFLVLLLPIVAGVLGALASSLMLGRAHARRVVFWAGTLIALVSCASPILQPADVAWSARILLLLMHIVTWFLVVPQLARIVGDSEPGASVERD
jgi:hypothetical protein